MIDHVLGRPSSKSRRLQVLAVLSFWVFYLYKGDKHGPPVTQSISRVLTKRLTAWQTVAITMMYLYAARNFSALVDLASPEPMANMYDATYFRATWVLTALDAGFWTAMKIRNKPLRDLAGFVFSLYYLMATSKADEKVRKVRGMLTVEHLRVAWNKGTTPYLGLLQRLMRPRFTRWPPRQVRIPRPASSDYKEPVMAWLYYDGPLADVAHHSKLILDVPGGGFVAMDPRCNDDKLFAWASMTGLPILSIDYKKAPEYPYPHAVNEIFDVYASVVQTRGRCIGMSGRETPRVIVTGDSAGGNLAVAATLMILETGSSQFSRLSGGSSSLDPPEGMVLFYPALDMNIGNWMTDEQMALISDRRMRKTNKLIVRGKRTQYTDLVGTPHHSEDEDEAQGETKAKPDPSAPRPEYSHNGSRDLGVTALSSSRSSSSSAATTATTTTSSSTNITSSNGSNNRKKGMSHHPEPMRTRLATSSMISYFNDRVLSPEMMRAMIILYIGPHNRPDFGRDYLLSPVLAPEALLAKFPRTYFMTGERDPLVDDTVIFAGRLRRAKEAAARAGRPRSIEANEEEWQYDDREAAEVLLIPGTSHGFMQFPGVYPPAWKHFERSAAWFEQLFSDGESRRAERAGQQGRRGRRRSAAAESSGDEDRPLEMRMTKMRGRAGQSAAPEPEGNGSHSNGNGNGNGKRSRKLRSHSLVKLSSSDDLLGRRMHGLTSGLAGRADED